MMSKAYSQNKAIASIGMKLLVLMMLFVVGNNIVIIGSATTVYGTVTPNTIEYPGQLSVTGELLTPFVITNGSSVQALTPDPLVAGSITTLNTVLVGGAGSIVYAVSDWTHPGRMFGVDSSLNVFYWDATAQQNLTLGFYTPGIWPIACSNCNPIYKIGVLTTLNVHMNGFIDSNGDLLIAEDMAVVKFVQSSDYAKTTYLTVSGYTASHNGDVITSIGVDTNNHLHILIGGTSTISTFVAYLNHQVYSGTTLLFTEVLESGTGDGVSATGYYRQSSMLLLSNPVNSSTDIVYAYKKYSSGGNVYLKSKNATAKSDICPTFCATITGFNGLQIYGGFAYIASSSENKIYRFPTTITVGSGTGFVPGIGPESTDQPELTYTTKSINSLYANYYNTTKFTIQSTILFDSGFWILGSNYGVDSQDYRWQLRLVDPNGVTVNSWDSSACVDSVFYGTCSLTILREYSPPSGGWMEGNWYVKLYEHKVGSSLVGAEVGNLALLTTSATWNVYNASVSANATGIIGSPTEPIDSPSSIQTISQIDGIVGLMGFGINGVSKFLFVLLITISLFIVGLYYSRSGMIGLALSSLPYTFFAYISYVPKWTFIIYIILLLVVAKVFR